jgi:beta-glucosidase
VSPKGTNTPIKPIQLKGFHRVELTPGATKNVHFSLNPEQLAHWDNGAWAIEPGQYEILVGASSADIRLKGVIELTGERRVFSARTVFFSSSE